MSLRREERMIIHVLAEGKGFRRPDVARSGRRRILEHLRARYLLLRTLWRVLKCIWRKRAGAELVDGKQTSEIGSPIATEKGAPSIGRAHRKSRNGMPSLSLTNQRKGKQRHKMGDLARRTRWGGCFRDALGTTVRDRIEEGRTKNYLNLGTPITLTVPGSGNGERFTAVRIGGGTEAAELTKKVHGPPAADSPNVHVFDFSF